MTGSVPPLGPPCHVHNGATTAISHSARPAPVVHRPLMNSVLIENGLFEQWEYLESLILLAEMFGNHLFLL